MHLSHPGAPLFVPMGEDAPPPTTTNLRLDLRSEAPLAAEEPWAPPEAPSGEEPQPGQAVADRFLIAERLRGLGTATLHRAVDLDLNHDVLLLVELEPAAGAGGGRWEIRRSAAPLHPHLLPQLEVGSWSGLRFASFSTPRGVPLPNLALPPGGRLPALHVATLAARSVAGLAALHDDGRLLGGVYPGSLIVNPWGLHVHLVGWARRADPARHVERAAHELRSLGNVLVRMRGLRGSHPAEAELDELLRLVASSHARLEGMPTALVARALDGVAHALERG
jgi:hypothetical protein